MPQLAPASRAAAEATTIRPFHIDVPEAELVDLRRRIAETQWPEKETVADQLPLIVNHGWPGSIIEQLKIIDPLTNPTAYGGSASD
ncbi:MAG TPA: hypothetical protein VIQ60_09660, partial [Gemmatimonadaceae bacterium]